MTHTAAHRAAGTVIAVEDSAVVFNPRATRYELRLATAGRYDGPLHRPVCAVIRARARRVQTVSAGGCFIEPIAGSPRVAQGRIVHVDEKEMVISAGAMMVVELPAEDHAYSLSRGPLRPGALANVALLPGATFEPVVSVNP